MDEIEKKQIYVDRLNRKYDALTSGQEEENLGPLEATIKNLTKDISRKEKESGEMQVRRCFLVSNIYFYVLKFFRVDFLVCARARVCLSHSGIAFLPLPRVSFV